MNEADDNLRVLLARIEGKQDVTNERLGSVQTEVAGLRSRVHSLGNEMTKIIAERTVMAADYARFTVETGARLTSIEKWMSSSAGERRGIIAGGKLLWGVLGTILGGGGLAALMKLFGV